VSTADPYEPTGRQIAARPLVRGWLLLLALLVLAMVVVGGATRLTGSGLSITEWAPVTGVVPPMSEAAWLDEFEKYREIPQYQLVNRGMSLDEFKTIYWWEWGHRFLGRLVGLVFLVPFVWFWATGRLEKRLVPWVLGAFFLGGLQGVLGWYMVASGLSERVTVSQYRLAAHLTLAAIIFVYLLWLAERLRVRGAEPSMPSRLKWGAGAILGLSILQIALGAFVAGLHAGLTYQSWPLMDGRFVPGGLMRMEPWWANFFENVTMVQFNHRMLGYVLVMAAIAHAVDCLRQAGEGPVTLRAGLLAGAMVVQAGLGIATLLSSVSLELALLHQAGAMAVLTIAVIHMHALIALPTSEAGPLPGAGAGNPGKA
jgi:heme a synthase